MSRKVDGGLNGSSTFEYRTDKQGGECTHPYIQYDTMRNGNVEEEKIKIKIKIEEIDRSSLGSVFGCCLSLRLV